MSQAIRTRRKYCYRGAGDESAQEPGNAAVSRLADLFGLLTAPFLGFSFAHSGDILAVLAIVAGVALLMHR